jgi:hypothetical protein
MFNEFGQSLSCPNLIDEKHARLISWTRSKGSPASMLSGSYQKNNPISVALSPLGSPSIRRKQGFVSPRKNAQPLSHKQSNNSLYGLFSRKSSQITDASLLSSNKSHPTGKYGQLPIQPESQGLDSQVPLTCRTVDAVAKYQPMSASNSQLQYNHTTIHIKVDNDNIARVVDVKGGYANTIDEDLEPEGELPSGMPRDTFDRCCRWVEQVNLACKDNRSVEDCARVPVHWGESDQGTDRA